MGQLAAQAPSQYGAIAALVVLVSPGVRLGSRQQPVRSGSPSGGL
jgi:hypothetical protein